MNELVTMNNINTSLGITIKEPEAYYVMQSLRLRSGLAFLCNEFSCNSFYVIIRHTEIALLRHYTSIQKLLLSLGFILKSWWYSQEATHEYYLLHYDNIPISTYSIQMFSCSLLMRGHGGEVCTWRTKRQSFADLQKSCSE